MRVLGFKRLPLVPILAFLASIPLGVEGQLRTVVSNEIAVSESEATLHLGFEDRTGLTISFQGGEVFLDGEAVGTFQRGDGLHSAWRSLLGEVITLDDGPLALALNDWEPPSDLSGDRATLAARLDQVLETSLASGEETTNRDPQEGITVRLGSEGGLISALLNRRGALEGLAEALEGLNLDNFTLKVGEDLTVEAGEILDGNVVLVDGDLDLAGTVDGNVVVAGGTVRLRDTGSITGDLRVADGTVDHDGGSISGSLIELDERAEVETLTEDRLEQLREEWEAEIRRDLRLREDRGRRSHSGNVFTSFVGNVGSAIAGLLKNLVTFLILAILGVLAVQFQRERLEIIATTARRAPVRSAVVGLAGGFFILPIWIVGIIALAITIIGIPVLLAWIPLFPIAAGLAILLGFLGVARNVGEWVAEQEYRGLEWIRGSNTFYTIVAGVGALMVPCVAASASEILGFGFLTGMLAFAGSVVTFAASAVGLGAVLLTRGGKIRPLESYYDFEEEYWVDVDPQPSDYAAPESDHATDEKNHENSTSEADAPDQNTDPVDGDDDEGTGDAGEDEVKEGEPDA
jgi:cytoskeletal protein CcmA (bactofilin family)